MLKIIVLAIGLINAHVQDSTSFKLYFEEQCRDTVWLNRAYYFTKANDTIKIKVNPKTGVCRLLEKGIYKLHLLENDYPLTYHFIGQTKDTIKYPKLYFGLSTVSDVYKSDYVNCDQIADGIIIDWLTSDKKRCEGKFKRGKLIGKLVYYDLDGRIVKIEEDPRKKRK